MLTRWRAIGVFVLVVAAAVPAWILFAPAPRSPPSPPIPPLGPARVKPQIALGKRHVLVLAPDGTLCARGDNQQGQLGFGYQSGWAEWGRVGRDTDWVAVAVTFSGTCALKRDGTLWGWGGGINPNGPVSSPTLIGSATNWVALVSGIGHWLGLRNDGSLWGWGDNSAGQLADGTGRPSAEPVRIGAGARWLAVGALHYESVGLQADGSLWLWGQEDRHWVNAAPFPPIRSPMRWGAMTNLDTAAWPVGQTLALDGHSAALLTPAGELWVWGAGWGDPQRTNKLADLIARTRTQVDPGQRRHYASPPWLFGRNPWTSVAAGEYSMLGLQPDGSLWAWGIQDNDWSRQPLGSPPPTNAVRLDERNDWLAAATFDGYRMGLTADGTVWGWGFIQSPSPSPSCRERLGNAAREMGLKVDWGISGSMLPWYNVPQAVLRFGLTQPPVAEKGAEARPVAR